MARKMTEKQRKAMFASMYNRGILKPTSIEKVNSIQQERALRSKKIDSLKTSKHTVSIGDEFGRSSWANNPGKYDIEGIDDKNAKSTSDKDEFPLVHPSGLETELGMLERHLRMHKRKAEEYKQSGAMPHYHMQMKEYEKTLQEIEALKDRLRHSNESKDEQLLRIYKDKQDVAFKQASDEMERERKENELVEAHINDLKRKDTDELVEMARTLDKQFKSGLHGKELLEANREARRLTKVLADRGVNVQSELKKPPEEKHATYKNDDDYDTIFKKYSTGEYHLLSEENFLFADRKHAEDMAVKMASPASQAEKQRRREYVRQNYNEEVGKKLYKMYVEARGNGKSDQQLYETGKQSVTDPTTNDYNRVLHGVSAVLKSKGVDASPSYLSTEFHSPLVFTRANDDINAVGNQIEGELERRAKHGTPFEIESAADTPKNYMYGLPFVADKNSVSKLRNAKEEWQTRYNSKAAPAHNLALEYAARIDKQTEILKALKPKSKEIAVGQEESSRIKLKVKQSQDYWTKRINDFDQKIDQIEKGTKRLTLKDLPDEKDAVSRTPYRKKIIERTEGLNTVNPKHFDVQVTKDKVWVDFDTPHAPELVGKRTVPDDVNSPKHVDVAYSEGMGLKRTVSPSNYHDTKKAIFFSIKSKTPDENIIKVQKNIEKTHEKLENNMRT